MASVSLSNCCSALFIASKRFSASASTLTYSFSATAFHLSPGVPEIIHFTFISQLSFTISLIRGSRNHPHLEGFLKTKKVHYAIDQFLSSPGYVLFCSEKLTLQNFKLGQLLHLATLISFPSTLISQPLTFCMRRDRSLSSLSSFASSLKLTLEVIRTVFLGFVYVSSRNITTS